MNRQNMSSVINPEFKIGQKVFVITPHLDIKAKEINGFHDSQDSGLELKIKEGFINFSDAFHTEKEAQNEIELRKKMPNQDLINSLPMSPHVNISGFEVGKTVFYCILSNQKYKTVCAVVTSIIISINPNDDISVLIFSATQDIFSDETLSELEKRNRLSQMLTMTQLKQSNLTMGINYESENCFLRTVYEPKKIRLEEIMLFKNSINLNQSQPVNPFHYDTDKTSEDFFSKTNEVPAHLFQYDKMDVHDYFLSEEDAISECERINKGLKNKI